MRDITFHCKITGYVLHGMRPDFSPRLPLPVSQTTTAQVAQEGGTGGGGVLSGNGTANSAAKAGVRLVLGNDLRVNFAGRSGASAGSLAARGGQYNQTAGSRSGA